MKVINYTHPSGIITEAIELFENDEFNYYVVFKDINNTDKIIIEIDRRSGFSINYNYEKLKTMTDKEIFKLFFPNC